MVQGIQILGFSKLTDVIRFLEGKEKFEDRIKKSCENTQRKDMMFDFKDVKGQKEIIEASLLAAAGGHKDAYDWGTGVRKDYDSPKNPNDSSRNDGRRMSGGHKDL